MADQFARGRAAFARHAWEEAYIHLAAPADESGDVPNDEISATDLERLAVAAYMLGRDAESDAAWEAAHRRHLAADDSADAARCSFWLALCLLLRGQVGHAGGWLSRTRRVIESTDGECAAAGYVLIPELLGALDRGDAGGAHAMSVEAREIGERVDDPDLRALATLANGQALIQLGDLTGGTARLDEVMLSVTAGRSVRSPRASCTAR